MRKVTPSLVVESVQCIAFNDERIVARNDDYEVHIKVLNPEYQGFYEKGELMLDPDEVDALLEKFEDLEGNDDQSVVIKDLNETVNDLHAKISTQASTISDLNTALMENVSKINSQASTITSLNSQISSLNEQLSGHKSDATTIASQEQTIASLKEEISNLKKKSGK